jgi:hypothetical protein
MAQNAKDSFSKALTLFSSLYQDMSPADLPEGLSPDNQDQWPLPGSTGTRPGLQRLLGAAFPNLPAIMSVADFSAPSGDFWMMSLDSLGVQRWTGVLGQAPAQINVLPGVQCKAESAFDKQWFAYYSSLIASQQAGTSFSDDYFVGVDVPRYVDGLTGITYRVTSDAPGANPIVLADIAPTVRITSINNPTGAVIVASPNGATESGSIVTIQTTTPHGLHAGDFVSIVGVGVAGYNNPVPSPWQVIATPSPTVFTYAISVTGLAPSGGGSAIGCLTQLFTSTPHGLNQGDAFTVAGTANYDNAPANPVNPPFWTVFQVISPTEISLIGIGSSGTGPGTLTVGGLSVAGPRNCVLLFVINGEITGPSVPIQFTSAGQRQFQATSVPLGPPGCTQRILAFTQAYGSTYFYLKAAKIPGIGGLPSQTSLGTIINDNVSTSILLDFSDAQLATGVNISAPGNDLFNQIVLAPCLGVIEYQQRLFWWGEINNIKNLQNCGFEGGYVAPLASAIPLGWSAVGSTGGTAGLVQSTMLATGLAYSMQSAGGLYDCMISQPAQQDYYGGPIFQPSLAYLTRIAVSTRVALTQGELVCDLYSPSLNQILAVSSRPAAGIPVTPNIYAWITMPMSNAMPAVVPSDLIVRIYLQGIDFGKTILIDEVEFINANQPVLNNQMRASYVGNPFGYDEITGIIGLDSDDSITACFKQRDYLYPLTNKGRWITQNNGTTEPYLWPISLQEEDCGCAGPNAVTVTEGVAFWAGRQGRRVFTGGSQSKLVSLEVKGYWDQINWASELFVWVATDTIERMVHFGVPIGPNAITPTADIPLSYRAVDAVYNVPDPIRQSFRGNMIALELCRKSTVWFRALNCGAMITRQLPPGNAGTGIASLFVLGGGNGLAPGVGQTFGNLYWLNVNRFSDDDYGVIGNGTGNYYITFGWWTHDTEEAIQQLGSYRKLYGYCGVYITGIGLVTITPYVDDLNHPFIPTGATFNAALGYWVPNVTPNPLPSYQLSQSIDHDLEWALNITGNRVFFKVQVQPLPGQKDAAFKLQHMIVSGRLEQVFPVRGAVL